MEDPNQLDSELNQIEQSTEETLTTEEKKTKELTEREQFCFHALLKSTLKIPEPKLRLS